MKLLLLIDYPSGLEVTKYLKQRGEEIVGIFIPPSGTLPIKGFPGSATELLTAFFPSF